MLVYPSSVDLIVNEALTLLGTIEILPMESPLAVFVWNPKRITPVRINSIEITEEAFDTNLNPIRAKVTLDMRVLNVNDTGFLNPAGALYMVYQIEKEALAIANAIQTFGNAGRGLCRYEQPDRHLRRRRRHERSAYRPKQPLLRSRPPRPGRSRTEPWCATSSGASSRSPTSTPRCASTSVIQGDRIDTVANAQLGDPLLYWILCDANAAIGPGRADGGTRSRGAHHLARGDRRGGNDRQHRGQQWLAASTSRLLVGPMVPLPAPKPVIDALTSVEVTTPPPGAACFS